MKYILFAIVALAISLVSAEIKITKPVASTKWSFGKTETVEWTAGPTDTGAKDLYVVSIIYNIFKIKIINRRII